MGGEERERGEQASVVGEGSFFRLERVDQGGGVETWMKRCCVCV
jgi:hypothetical protein